MSKDLLQIDDEAFDELMNGMHRPSWPLVVLFMAFTGVASASAVLFLVKGMCGA